jgi:ribose 5-phosphate isomerase RpiB
MRIAIGSDHAGFELEEHLNALLHNLGHEVTDLGTYTREPVDYRAPIDFETGE